MGRLLTLIVLVLVAVWLVRRTLHRLSNDGPGAATRAPSGTPSSEELVRCAHCGLLLPRGEARQSGGALYCGEEHARLGPRQSGGRD